jgi:hypothetical protein
MIYTWSKFLYGYTVPADGFYLNFNEGAGEITAELRPGKYSFTQLASEVSRALNAIGGQDYTVSVNRTNRTFTISAAANFSLLITSGANAGESVFTLIGFTGADVTGTNTYTSNNATGTIYSPQVRLQDFVSASDNSEYIQSTVNESSSGSIEIYSVGKISRFEFNLKYVNNHVEFDSSIIRKNTNALSELRSFMDFCITRSQIEFMPDESDLATYHIIQLEKTQQSQNGVGYKIKEMLGMGLGEFYETGLLIYRKVN